MAKPAFGKRVHAVSAGACIKHIGNQHRVIEGHGVDAVTAHDEPVIFHVLCNLENRLVLKNGLQGVERRPKWNLPLDHASAEKITHAGFVLERNISCLARCKCQRETDQFCLHRIKRIGFCIEGNKTGLNSFREPLVQRRKIANAGIGRGVDFLRKCRCSTAFR